MVDRRSFLRASMLWGGACLAGSLTSTSGAAMPGDPAHPLAPGLAGPATQPGETRPNIILIYLDDTGYEDLGCYGGTLVPTPHMDALASRGIRFTSGYVTAAVCSPSRLGLMSGAYQQRWGSYHNTDRYRYKLPDTQPLMPETLKKAGYVTGVIGKWNIARPAKEAFDETYSIMDWEGDYFPQADGRYVGVNDKKVDSSKVDGWGPPRGTDEYLTDRLGRQAAEFITLHTPARNAPATETARKPFFLYLPFNATHAPFQAKASFKEKVAHIEGEKRQLYAAMLLSLDENIGKVMKALETSGADANTLVVLVSDNGPVVAGRALRGKKSDLYEGGIREPFTVSWPGRIAPQQVRDTPVSTLDLYPTFCAVAGVTPNEGTVLDGVNLLPLWLGKVNTLPDRALFWKNQGGQYAVREGDMKLVGPTKDGPRGLYNLATDPQETKDLSLTHDQKMDDLLDKLHAWERTLPPYTPKPSP